MLDTPPHYKHLHMANAPMKSCIIMIMECSKMSKTEYDLKAIMYSAYDTPHKLCNKGGNYIIQQPRLPPNNAGRPIR